MKNNKSKITKAKKVKTNLSNAEMKERTFRLMSEYVPLCGGNKFRLKKLTGLNISTIYNAFARKEFKHLKAVFDNSVRIDHTTEMWQTKTDILEESIPKSEGTYKHLAFVSGMTYSTLKNFILDPRAEALKLKLDKRRREVKAERIKDRSALMKKAILKFNGDINMIAGYLNLTPSYMYRLLAHPSNPEIRKLITDVRFENKKSKSLAANSSTEVKGDPEFNIDSAIDSFLPHQIDFAGCAPDETKHPALIGGYGCGKTMSIPLRWVKLIEYRMAQGKNCDIMVIEPTTEMIRDILVPCFDEFFQKFSIPVSFLSSKKNYTITYRGKKHTCIFRSAERPRSLTGKNLTDIIIDEFERIPYYRQKLVWRECISRIRKAEHGTCAVVSTPEGFKLAHELWVEKNNKNGKNEKKNSRFKLLKAKTMDNIYLPQDYIENLLEQYDSKLAKQYLEGEFVNIESDLVYYCFDRKVNVIADEKIPAAEDNRIIISFDFNVNPMCAVEIIMNDKTRYQVYEYKISNSNTKDLCGTIINSLKQRYENPYEMNIILTGDASGAARSSSGEHSDFDIIRKSFNDAGFLDAYLSLQPANPPVRERVNYVNSILEKKQFYIAASCKASIKDRELVSWKKGSGKFIIDKSDRDTTHLSDASDYGLWISRYTLISKDNNPIIVYESKRSRYL